MFIKESMKYMSFINGQAARSKAWVDGRLLAGMSVSCECCVLSGTGLCVGPITRPEESCRVWCLSVIVKPRKWGGPGQLGALTTWKERRSLWPCSLRRRSTAALLLGSRVRIPLRALMFVSCVCCVGSGLCDELITRPEESYRTECECNCVWYRNLNNEAA
jgi:hypothetical protein